MSSQTLKDKSIYNDHVFGFVPETKSEIMVFEQQQLRYVDQVLPVRSVRKTQTDLSDRGRSIQTYENDFELVIRTTKEMEYLLVNHFGAPAGKKSGGLQDKITNARIPRTGKSLPQKCIQMMRKLVTIRNALVHDQGVNSIDREEFATGWWEVHRQLKIFLYGKKANVSLTHPQQLQNKTRYLPNSSYRSLRFNHS